MSYTPPSGDEADFSWVGAALYTMPLGDAADFSWQSTAQVIRYAIYPADETPAFSGGAWVGSPAAQGSELSLIHI